MDQRLQRRRRVARRRQKFGLSRRLLELMPHLKSSIRYTRLASKQLQSLLGPLLGFFKESARVIKRCAKPDRHGFQRSVLAIILGLLIMGFLGFIIKLLHIPVTNIIMG